MNWDPNDKNDRKKNVKSARAYAITVSFRRSTPVQEELQFDN
jgi:hypothetical protein